MIPISVCKTDYGIIPQLKLKWKNFALKEGNRSGLRVITCALTGNLRFTSLRYFYIKT